MTLEELQSALSAANASVARLEGKNEELIGKLHAADQKVKEAEAEAKKVEDAEKRATTAEASLSNMKAEQALNAVILAHNVDNKHIPLILKAVKNDIKTNSKNEPTIDGKSIEDWGKDFFAADGLTYVRAANNTGGLATGNDGTAATLLAKKPETAEEWDVYYRMPDAERQVFDKAHSI